MTHVEKSFRKILLLNIGTKIMENEKVLLITTHTDTFNMIYNVSYKHYDALADTCIRNCCLTTKRY